MMKKGNALLLPDMNYTRQAFALMAQSIFWSKNTYLDGVTVRSLSIFAEYRIEKSCYIQDYYHK